ncbi:MAG: N-acetyl-gamma-glutamyl-phosphate reductase [Ginsengibacter sp.]|jgi:N-acetyl-gamma-glutamyl-phosphate reductase
MSSKIIAGIIESSGHVYKELITLFKVHPLVNLVYLKNELKSLSLNQLTKEKMELTDINGITISNKNNNQLDVLFICGEGEAGRKLLNNYTLPKKTKIICLTGEFRADETSLFEGRRFVYGLPELKKEIIEKANNISVPGSMATCVALGLLPIAHKKLLKNVYTTGISGATEEDDFIHAETKEEKKHKIKSDHQTSENTLREIKRPLVNLSKDSSTSSINFVPWKGEFSRGIFVTSQLKCAESLSEMYYIFENFYKERSFIHVSKKTIFLKKVLNTNNCFINLEKAGDILVVHSAIDNLVKGAAGQAIQNMNLMFGHEETLGLLPKASKMSKN